MQPKYYKWIRIASVFVFAFLLHIFLVQINSFPDIIERRRNYPWRVFYIEYFSCLILSTATIEGGYWINRLLKHNISLENGVFKVFLIQLFAHAAFVTTVVVLYFNSSLRKEICNNMALFGQVLILANLFCALLSLYFLFTNYNDKARIQAKRLEKEKSVAQLEALKTQLDPHFLFNNLSVLTSIAEEDNQKTVDFTLKLSSIYRYMLDNIKKDFVCLDQEINFIWNYIYMYEVRYGKSVQLNIGKDCDYSRWSIPPLVLQIVIENALKHNKFSIDKPLQIKIELDQHGSLVVMNNKELNAGVTSYNIGLQNIIHRYEILSMNEPVIIDTEQQFKVVLDLRENSCC